MTSPTMTPTAAVAHRVATTREQREHELANVRRAEAHIAVEDALHRYESAIIEATQQHATRLRIRGANPHRSQVQGMHDRAWASSLYWKATRRVDTDIAAAIAQGAA